MADMKILAQTTSKSRVGNGVWREVTGTKDGAIYTADYVLGLALEGKVFTAQLGTASTPVTFRTGYDADQPEMAIDVPMGVAIIPLMIQVVLEDSAGTDNEIVAEASPALTGEGTATAGSILNNKLNSGLTSSCAYRYTYSGNGTVPANYVEFFRFNHAFADEGGAIVGNSVLWTPQGFAPVVLVGEASLLLHISATATAPAGYAKIMWAEFTSTDL